MESTVSAATPARRGNGHALINRPIENCIFALFFCSGVASLICQVIWFKQLQFILSSSTFSVSVTVASFFLGLALGSWVGGVLADRAQHLLRIYGGLELSLAVVSLAITGFLANWEHWAMIVTSSLGIDSPFARPLMVLISFATLLPPTLLMGASLPLLAKYVVREQSLLAKKIGLLYGANTLGAAVGCALVGFYFIAAVGVFNSALVASGIYLVIAVIALGMSVGMERKPIAADDGMTKRSAAFTPARAASDGVIDTGESAHSAPLLLMVYAASGFVAIAYEIIWFRVIANLGIHTVFAFSGMLTVYLLGLVVGAFFCARFLAPHKDRLVEYFARVQLLIAVSSIVVLVLLGRARTFAVMLSSLLASLGIPRRWFDLFGNVEGIVLYAVIVLLPPTMLIGMSFPLASELTVRRLSMLGRRLGVLYSLNMIGGVMGSLAAGFLLLPWLGSQGGLVFLATCNLLLFVMVLVSDFNLRRQSALWRQGLLGLVMVGGTLWWIGSDYLKRSLTDYVGGIVAAFEESAEGTFVVIKYNSESAGDYQQMLYNGKSYANNSLPGRRYMATLAHLPALLHPDPRSGLVICIGTGTTIGALSQHPTLEEIYAVDLCPQPFALAPHFVPVNQRFYQNPRVNRVVADGRHFLLTTAEEFDVLTFEPPPPADAGVVNLYSREFYRLAKRRMPSNGVVAQWIPLDISRQIIPRMMVRTMLDEFAHVSLWIPNRMEGIAIGSSQPLTIDVEKLGQRMRSPRIKRDLHEIGFDSPESILASFVAADEALSKWIGDVPSVTDDCPRIEYHNFYPAKIMTYDEILAGQEDVEKYLTDPPSDPSALNRQRRITRSIWREHEAWSKNKLDAAANEIRRGLQMAPDNTYLQYLKDALQEFLKHSNEPAAARR